MKANQQSYIFCPPFDSLVAFCPQLVIKEAVEEVNLRWRRETQEETKHFMTDSHFSIQYFAHMAQRRATNVGMHFILLAVNTPRPERGQLPQCGIISSVPISGPICERPGLWDHIDWRGLAMLQPMRAPSRLACDFTSNCRDERNAPSSSPQCFNPFNSTRKLHWKDL